MSTTSLPSAPSTPPAESAIHDHAPADNEPKPALAFHFLLRRLHSLAGIIFGAYVVVHLTINATGLWPRAYQENVDRIHSLGPLLPVVEILFIFLPLLLHMLYGIYIAFAGVKFNTMKYNYGGNVRYFLQRWTGVLLLLFLLFHIGTLHKWGIFAIYQLTGEKYGWLGALGGRFNEHNQAFQSTVRGVQTYFAGQGMHSIANISIVIFYLLGVWSACFHFANGLWTAAIAWGLTITAHAQKRWGHVCFALGIVLLVIGTIAWWAFTWSANAQPDLSRWDQQTQTQMQHD